MILGGLRRMQTAIPMLGWGPEVAGWLSVAPHMTNPISTSDAKLKQLGQHLRLLLQQETPEETGYN